MVIAPLDANTLAKAATGICDNLVVSAVFISFICHIFYFILFLLLVLLLSLLLTVLLSFVSFHFISFHFISFHFISYSNHALCACVHVCVCSKAMYC